MRLEFWPLLWEKAGTTRKSIYNRKWGQGPIWFQHLRIVQCPTGAYNSVASNLGYLRIKESILLSIYVFLKDDYIVRRTQVLIKLFEPNYLIHSTIKVYFLALRHLWTEKAWYFCKISVMLQFGQFPDQLDVGNFILRLSAFSSFGTVL